MSVVGVLALQGDFEEHTAVFESLGAECKEIRLPKQMDDIDRLVIASFPPEEFCDVNHL